jgi:hypothetical protein
MGNGHCSWWMNHGIGCSIEVLNSTSPSGNSTGCLPVVTGCILPFYYVEVIHAGVQCILAVSVHHMLYFYGNSFSVQFLK